jgi:hypothetical protein
MLAVVVITYNVSSLLRKQVELIKRFCKDPFEIIIIDNSSFAHEAKSIKYHAELTGCKYIKTLSSAQFGSESHAFAANLSYNLLYKKYDQMLYLDHDCFPLKNFSVKATIKGKCLGGIAQEKTKTYFWPGCLMINNTMILPGMVDFSTSPGLDTGGGLHKVIERYGIGNCAVFDEVHVQNPGFSKSFYNFYSSINNGQFMHFINGSNWNQSAENEERLNSLLNVLETLTKED